LIRQCNCVVASTWREKQDIIKSYSASAEKITIIPCGVNLSLFKPTNGKRALRCLSPKSTRRILFVGRIEPLKGIEKLLMAVSYLKKRRKLKLLIIGDDDTSNPEIRKLQDLTEQLGIKKTVSFLGPRPQDELPHYYNIADLCVVPSQYESFGLVILEAMACGTPVLATPVGIANDIIQPKTNGYLLKDDNPHNMAQMIDQLLFIDQDEVGDVDAVRESVAEYDWSNVATAMTEKYSSLIRYPITVS
jgi:D-inositol-3-phosphate glycosyltransferase